MHNMDVALYSVPTETATYTRHSSVMRITGMSYWHVLVNTLQFTVSIHPLSSSPPFEIHHVLSLFAPPKGKNSTVNVMKFCRQGPFTELDDRVKMLKVKLS